RVCICAIMAFGSVVRMAALSSSEPNAMMAQIHTRMPVVIRPEDFTRWLDHSRPDGKQVADLMTPVEDSFFVAAETQLPGRKRKPQDAKPVPAKTSDDQLKLF
ncbi:MAG: SOS response-associated peptidase family protein, partial [Pseudomonadota bacterium]